MNRTRAPRLGAEAALALSRRGGAGAHKDRRTKRQRSRGDAKRASIREHS